MDQPRYEHDHCEHCTFLGTYERHDLYFCAYMPTVIARDGDEGDYISGLPFIKANPILALAAIRAIDRGLLDTQQIRDALALPALLDAKN